MQLHHSFDYSKIPQGQEFKARYMVSLSAEINPEKPRPRLNIAFAIDISGSMQGGKLENVKRAVMSVIPKLHPDDIISVTLFDDHVRTLIETTKIGNNYSHYCSLIERIESGGSTNLSGGYENSFRLCGQNVSEKTISRIIILTDGLANVGISNHEQLTQISRQYLQKGVSTSTIGTGRDYDHHLLGKMAEIGNGNTYYIENPDEAESVFNEELGNLLQLSASNCSIRFTMEKDSIIYQQLNNYVYREGKFILGDVYGGQSKSIIVEMTIPAFKTPGEYSIGLFTIEYDDVEMPEVVRRKITEKVVIQVVSEKEFETVSPDMEVTIQSILLMIAKAKDLAMEKADKGDFDAASNILLQCVKNISEIGVSDERIQSELSAMTQRAHDLKERREMFYDRVQSKRMYYEKEMMMKNRMSSYNMMMDRRSGMNNSSRNRSKTSKIIVIDVETTGLPIYPNNGFTDINKWPRMVSLSWGIFTTDGSLLEEKTMIIRPDGFSIPPESEKYHGISNIRAMNEGKPLRDVLNEMLTKLDPYCLIVAHNLSFDSGVILSEMCRYGMNYQSLLHLSNYCTMKEGARKLRLAKSPRLHELYTTLFSGRLIPQYDNQNVKLCAECFFEMNNN